jgi:hypothetical protein
MQQVATSTARRERLQGSIDVVVAFGGDVFGDDSVATVDERVCTVEEDMDATRRRSNGKSTKEQTGGFGPAN